MNAIINILWFFIIQQTIAGYFVYQWGFDHSAFTLLFKDKFAIPLLIICFGMPLYIVLVWLCTIYSEPHNGGEPEFPMLVATKVEDRFVPFFRKLSYFCFILLPWVGFIWMWVEFHDFKQQVWLTTDPSALVGKYDIVGSVTDFYRKWDTYRYGRQGAGDSYVPFWQPIIIMWPLTFFALLVAIRYSYKNVSLIWKN